MRPLSERGIFKNVIIILFLFIIVYLENFSSKNIILVSSIILYQEYFLFSVAKQW